MAFEIYPAAITLYPSDKQTFAIRCTPPPVLYDTLSSLTLNSDGTLSGTTSTLGSANVSQVLVDGTGSITWTFSANMLPGVRPGARLFLLCYRSLVGFRVYVEASSTIIKDYGGSTLTTISRTVAAGDQYKLEAAGQVFRLYINGTLSYTYATTGAINYPVFAQVALDSSVATPTITVPTFSGLWDFDSRVTPTNTWAIASGTIDDTSDRQFITYTAPATPGAFSMTCQFASSALQTATSVVTVPPLSILGSNSLTLQPSTAVLLKTNYDSAQTSLVTWSIVSGSGTLSSNKFTAPATAGTTELKAVSGDQDARLTITVPITLAATTSGGASTRAAKPGEALTVTTSMSGTLTWTAQCGTLTGSGTSRTWTAPSTTNIQCRITVTNGTDTKILTLEVRDAIPYTPTLNVTTEYGKKVVVSEAEDGTITGRSKTPKGQTPLRGELTFRNRQLTEFTAMRTFFDEHHPGTPVIYDDLVRSTRHIVYFDSDLRAEFFTSCAVDYAFRIREKVFAA